MSGHAYSNILLHTVFSTKERRPFITDEIRPRVHSYLGGIARAEFGRALCVGGTEDHLHGLILVKPTVAVSDALREWKSLSSGWMHQTFPASRDFAWQSGYGVFSVSERNAAGVRRYIEAQAQHHQSESYAQEFTGFLEQHGIEYDPQYVLG